MSADGWSAIAAWIALVLSILTPLTLLCGNRPLIWYTLDENRRQGHPQLRFYVSAGDRPLLFSIRAAPSLLLENAFVADGEATMFRDAFIFTEKKVVRGYIQKNETVLVVACFNKATPQGLIIIKWYNQRVQLFPWSFFWISQKKLRLLEDAQPLVRFKR